MWKIKSRFAILASLSSWSNRFSPPIQFFTNTVNLVHLFVCLSFLAYREQNHTQLSHLSSTSKTSQLAQRSGIVNSDCYFHISIWSLITPPARYPGPDNEFRNTDWTVRHLSKVIFIFLLIDSTPIRNHSHLSTLRRTIMFIRWRLSLSTRSYLLSRD